MTKTENFALNQWEPTDKLSRADFNADNAAIDAALGGCGNCRIVWGSYTGAGKYGAENANSLTFDFKPLAVMVDSGTGVLNGTNPTVLLRGTKYALSDCGGSASNDIMQVTWSDKGVSWYCPSSSAFQNNRDSCTYYYVALGTSE